MNHELLDYKCIDFKKLLLIKGKTLSLTDQHIYLLLLMLTLKEIGIELLTPQVLSQYSSSSLHSIDQCLLDLIQKHVIDRKNGVLDFKPLYLHLLEVKEVEGKEINLVSIFEDAFGRGLSQIEIGFINSFKISGFSDEMIIDALNESVKQGVLNFKYIEKILDNWKRYGKKEKNIPAVTEDHTPNAVKDFNWWEND